MTKPMVREGFPPLFRHDVDLLSHLLERADAGVEWVVIRLDIRRMSRLRENRLIKVNLETGALAITGRGRAAVHAFSHPVTRTRIDANMPCTDCGATPRVVYGGRVQPYCIDCKRKRQQGYRRAKQARLREILKSGIRPICPRCRDHPVHVSASGLIYAICADCRHEQKVNRRWARMRAIITRKRGSDAAD